MSTRPGQTVPNDTDWIRRSFMVPTQAIRASDSRRDLFRSATEKFTDTTLGGNFAINPPPQFTRPADPTVRNIFGIGRGMGRYYSEAIDDTGFNIHMGFGVPSFNSLTRFFTTYYDANMGSLARTGRERGLFYTLGSVAGTVLTIPFMPMVWAGQLWRFASENPSSKYYFLKPTMPNYWSAVNQIVNWLATYKGVSVPFMDRLGQLFGSDTAAGQQAKALGPGYTDADRAAYHNLMPDIYREGGGIDVFAVANRAQRLNDQYYKALVEASETVEEGGSSGYAALTNRISQYVTSNGAIDGSDKGKFGGSFNNYMDEWLTLGGTQPDGGNGGEEGDELQDEAADDWVNEDSGFMDFLKSDVRDGSRWITFRVNNGGDSVSESASNSTKESQLSQTINGMSSSGRDKRFSFAGGNLGDGTIANTLEGFMGAIGDFATGVAEKVGAAGIAQLSGAAFADIPEMWDSSQFDFPTSSYTMELRSPYGNKMAQFQNLYLPLAMILAGALPISTGKNSYASPFLCEMFARGRNQIRLGIIDSLEITRGVGNLGWTAEGDALGIDVTFTVKDLSSVMHMPLRTNPALIEEDTPFTDYMATLGSLSLADQVYPTKKLYLSLSRRAAQTTTLASPARWGSIVGGMWPGRLANAFTRATGRDGAEFPDGTQQPPINTGSQ